MGVFNANVFNSKVFNCVLGVGGFKVRRPRRHHQVAVSRVVASSPIKTNLLLESVFVSFVRVPNRLKSNVVVPFILRKLKSVDTLTDIRRQFSVGSKLVSPIRVRDSINSVGITDVRVKRYCLCETESVVDQTKLLYRLLSYLLLMSDD